jgi:hypothetical protein
MDNDYVTREELAETAGAVWWVGILLLCVLAPAAVMTGLWWLAGFGLVWLLFVSSAFRTFALFVVGGVCVYWGSGDGKLLGYWLIGAAVLNSAVAQFREHGWNVLEWWPE